MTEATKTETIMCHSCNALNRVPHGRALTDGRCGKCSTSLATPHPVNIDGTQLARLQSKDTGAFVIDIWAPWCGPCRTMAPMYDKAADRFRDSARLFKLDSEAHQEAAGRLGLRGVPTLMAWRGGKQVANQAGAPPGEALLTWISQSLYL